nr:hypothetical protein [Tanacetum cinerariifolium]
MYNHTIPYQQGCFQGPAFGYRPRDRDLQCEEDQAGTSRGHYGGRRQSSATQEYPSLIDTFFVSHTVNGEEMGRLEATGTYTDDEINRLARRGGLLDEAFKSDPKYSDAFSQFESVGASGSGRCGDDEESADDQEDEDEDGDGDGDS